MTAPEISRYRGYDIVPRQPCSSWCAGIYPTRADLPILPRSTLRTLAHRAEAKHTIESISFLSRASRQSSSSQIQFA
jgi:hypothetical protein